MMEWSSATGCGNNFCVTARANSVQGQPGLAWSMLVLVPAGCVLGTAFLAVGAWPVTVCLALHIAALVAAFRYVERHADDFERLCLEGDRLVVDTHSPDEDRHLEFNSYWVQVDLEPSVSGFGRMLALRSHGKAFLFGSLLSDTERAALGRELKQRLARIRT